MKRTNFEQIFLGTLLNLIVLLACPLNAQLNHISTLSFAADHMNDEHKALTISADGCMYVSINAKKLSVLNSSNATTDFTNTINSVRAGMLVKVDPNNNVLWSNMVAADPVSAKNSQVIAAKEVGEFVYVIGGVASNVNTPSPVHAFGVPAQSQGFMDYYIAKLNSANGQAVWVKTFGSARDWELFIKMDADAQGNIYAAGYFGNIASGPLEFEHVKLSVANNWGEDYFVVKFNEHGGVVWAKNIGSKFRENDDFFGLSMDKHGNALLAISSNSRSRNNLTSESETRRAYEVGDVTYYLHPEDKKSDALLVKLAAADGTIMWSRFFTGTGDQRLDHVVALSESADVVVIGKSEQNIILQGSDGFTETTITHPLTASSPYFIMAFDAVGNALWYKSPQGEMDIRTVCGDGENGFYVGGSFNTYASFGESVSLQATDGNVKEGFFARYANNGDCKWGRTIKGIGGQSVKRIDVEGRKLAISGDRASDAIFPFDEETVVPYNIGGVNFNWYAVSYDIPVTGLEDKVLHSSDNLKFNNPVSNGMLHLQIPGSDELLVQVADLSGRVLLEKQIKASADISALNAGIYLLRVSDKNSGLRYTEKLIVK